MNGYIKLYRALLDHSVFANEKMLKVWIWCLLKATHAPYDQMCGRQNVHLEPSQFITGRKAASIELNMKESTVWDYVKLLERNKMVTLISNNKYTIVTVENWASYQNEAVSSDSKSTANQQQMDTNKKSKNIRSNIYAQKFAQFYGEYPKKRAKQSALKAWEKLKPDDDLFTKIMQGLVRWKQSPDWLKDDGQFIPYPATWLNGRRWEDEIEEEKPKNYVN